MRRRRADTATATDEIQQQVSQMQLATQSAVDALGDITTIIARMNAITAAIAEAVQRQEAAAREITHNILVAATSAQSVSRDIGEVRTVAGLTGTSVDDVLSSSAALVRQSEHLEKETDTSVRMVRVR